MDETVIESAPTCRPRVAYISSPSLLAAADKLPSNPGRASLVHELIASFDLLPSYDSDDPDEAAKRSNEGDASRLIHVESVPATREELLEYHDPEFVDALLGTVYVDSDSDDSSSTTSHHAPRSFGFSANIDERPRKRSKLEAQEPDDDAQEEHEEKFGLEDDCPTFAGMADYVCQVAGASICAARELRDGRADIAIAWTGGRHHAQRSAAKGFCFVSDIVLAILELKRPPRGPAISTPKRIKRVMYIDIDLHHGDGVSVAFSTTPSILTLSLHLFAPLFFPATGALSSTGPSTPSPAAYHDLNIAAHEGLSSPSLLRLFDSCIAPTIEIYAPEAIVLQVGCDGLAEDPCAEFNLSLEGIGEVVRRICDWRSRAAGRKLLMLGGGGYRSENAARCWTYCTSVALERPLSLQSPIPASLDSYPRFAPSFVLDVPSGNRIDKNTEERLQHIELAFACYHAKLREKYEKSEEI